MSAKQCRMSPTLYLPVTSASSSSRPVTRPSRAAISRTLTLSPLPTLTACPAASSRSSARAQARAEERQHAGVGVRQRLVGPVDVEEAQRRRRHVVRGAEEQAHPLLVVL